MWALIFFLPFAWGQLTVSTFSAGANIPTFIVNTNTQIFNVRGIVWNCTTPSPPLPSFGQFALGKLDLARLLDCLKYYDANSCIQNSTFPLSSGSTKVNLLRGNEAIVPTQVATPAQQAEAVIFNFYVPATCNSVADSKATATTDASIIVVPSPSPSPSPTPTPPACSVSKYTLSSINATTAVASLPVAYKVPCEAQEAILTISIENTTSTPRLGILTTTFGGRAYNGPEITLRGTASQLNASLTQLYFTQTIAGKGFQTINYNWTSTGFSPVLNTLTLYATGTVAVSPDSSQIVTNSSEPVIVAGEDPTRESAPYSVRLLINPSEFTNDLATVYISLIYRVHKKLIKVIAYSFSNNKFQVQQSGADVKFSFVGLSASQEARAVNIAKINCAQLSQSAAAKVDCNSLSSSTSAQSNSGVTKSSSGLVAGAIVGIIIGSVALAIIIALCIGFVVMKMQSAPQPHYPDKEGEPVPQYVNYAAPVDVYPPAPVAAVPQLGYGPGPTPYTATYA